MWRSHAEPKLCCRETYLLWNEEESSNQYQQYVVTIIAHELSHQWFGDLVTLDWWSDVFLNEGFATYFEYHASDEVRTTAFNNSVLLRFSF